MASTPSGSCRITLCEILHSSPVIPRSILALAAKHGCPAEGVADPQPVEGVTYTRVDHPNGDIEIRWDTPPQTSVAW